MPSNAPKREALTVPMVAPLVRALKEKGTACCCLHVVLEDGNIRDMFMDGVAERALELGHMDCYALAIILGQMSRTQRGKLARI